MSEQLTAPDTPCWRLVHTKPRQERIALENLERQGFHCYLPTLLTEKLVRRKLVQAQVPLFPRYLFIKPGPQATRGFSPVQSTLGVTRLVRFGQDLARVPDALVDALRAQEADRQQPQRMFEPQEAVTVTAGPFAGLQAVYQMADGEARALVLIEILSKPVAVPVPVTGLRKVA